MAPGVYAPRPNALDARDADLARWWQIKPEKAQEKAKERQRGH